MAHPTYPLWFVTRPHWRTLLRIWQRTAFVCRFNTLAHRLEGQQKVGGTTAQAIELRQSGENSILGNIAVNVSPSLTQALRSACWWNSTKESPDDVTTEVVSIALNTDFSTKGLSSQEIQSIVAAWQAGAISRETMPDRFRRGEVLPEGRTNEAEVKLPAASPVVSAVHGTRR